MRALSQSTPASKVWSAATLRSASHVAYHAGSAFFFSVVNPGATHGRPGSAEVAKLIGVDAPVRFADASLEGRRRGVALLHQAAAASCTWRLGRNATGEGKVEQKRERFLGVKLEVSPRRTSGR